MGMVGCIDAPFPDPSQCAVLPGARLGGEEGQLAGGAQRPEEGAIAQVERNGCPFFAVDTYSNSNFQCGLGVGGGMGRVGGCGSCGHDNSRSLVAAGRKKNWDCMGEGGWVEGWSGLGWGSGRERGAN